LDVGLQNLGLSEKRTAAKELSVIVTNQQKEKRPLQQVQS
jgi:hypothetical protein